MLADDIVARLGTVVTQLTNRVQGALALTEMLRQRALPNYTPAAFVVPNGLAFGAAEFGANSFVQAVDEVISIILVIRSASDVRGARAQGELQPLIWAVVNALAGWAPHVDEEPLEEPDQDDVAEIGVLVPRSGRLVRLDAGTVYYQLDFAIQQQVRVIS